MAPKFLQALALAATILVAGLARAEIQRPSELNGIDIEEKSGSNVPTDVKLLDQEGRPVVLGSYLDGERPLLIVLAYYECPMLCSLVLNGAMQSMSGLAWTAGKDYRVLTVSFDPRDRPEMAKNKRTHYVEAYGRNVGDKGWDFAVGEASEVRRLADALGFHYRYDEDTKQFAHAAGLFVLTPQGKLSQTLYGISWPATDLRLALTDASHGKLGTAWDKVLLFCFHYDPAARGYVLASTRLMRGGGVLTVLGLVYWLRRLWRNDGTRRPAALGTLS
jgi:protein SCO1/2